MSAREYHCNGLAGCVVQRQIRSTHVVTHSVYHNAQAGLDASQPWSTVCETHGCICSHATLALARKHLSGMDWCEACRAMNVKEQAIRVAEQTYQAAQKRYNTWLYRNRYKHDDPETDAAHQALKEAEHHLSIAYAQAYPH